MGLRGPKPKPPAVRALEGTAKRAPRKAAAPTPGADLPAKPRWLSKVASAKWDSLAPELSRLGLLSSIDGDALAAYCVAWSDFVAAAGEVQSGGLIVTRGTGALAPHPAVAIARAAAQQMARLGASLGLSPEARAALGVGAVDPEDDALGRFLAGVK